MGRLRALIPIALALVIAIAGSVFIYNWMQQQTGRQEVTEKKDRPEMPETVDVAVAAVDISAGKKLSREILQSETFIKKSLTKGYFSDPSELSGRVALAPIQKGEPIIAHRLAPTDVKTGGVSALISEGKRAVSLGGDKVMGISGFIHPGNRVDVMVTWQDPDSEEEITKRILENVRVLATGTQMQEVGEGETRPVDVYTLEVTPQEAEILTHIRNKGSIQMALRNPVDTDSILTEGATASLSMDYMYDLAGKTRLAENLPPSKPAPEKKEDKPAPEETQIAKAPNPSPPSRTVVELIQNDSLVEKKF